MIKKATNDNRLQQCVKKECVKKERVKKDNSAIFAQLPLEYKLDFSIQIGFLPSTALIFLNSLILPVHTSAA